MDIRMNIHFNRKIIRFGREMPISIFLWLPPVHPKSSGHSIVRELWEQGTKREKNFENFEVPISIYIWFSGGFWNIKAYSKFQIDLQREYLFNVSRDPGRRLGEVWIRWDPSQTWSDWAILRQNMHASRPEWKIWTVRYIQYSSYNVDVTQT